MLLILTPQTTFIMLAQALDDTGLDLVNVQACTFPSRPEPRRAQWAGDRGLVLAYVYEPDIELRYLWLCGQWPTTISSDLHTYLRPHADLFDDWSVLYDHLHSASYPHVVRAVSAWRTRAIRGDSQKAQQEAADTLVDCLRESDDVHTRRLIADQLEHCAGQEHLATLEDLSQKDDDVEVRLHIHRTIQLLQARQIF